MVRVLVCIYILIQSFVIWQFVTERIKAGGDFGTIDVLKIIETVCLSIALFVLAKRSREQMLKERARDNQ